MVSEHVSLTRSSPHFSQVAVHLSRLLAELHHIAAHRLGSYGHLCEMLVVVAEVHGQEHLKKKKKSGKEHLQNLIVYE